MYAVNHDSYTRTHAHTHTHTHTNPKNFKRVPVQLKSPCTAHFGHKTINLKGAQIACMFVGTYRGAGNKDENKPSPPAHVETSVPVGTVLKPFCPEDPSVGNIPLLETLHLLKLVLKSFQLTGVRVCACACVCMHVRAPSRSCCCGFLWFEEPVITVIVVFCLRRVNRAVQSLISVQRAELCCSVVKRFALYIYFIIVILLLSQSSVKH